MRNTLFILLIILIPLSQVSCSLDTRKNIEKIKKKYSSRVINYFYELALYDTKYPKKLVNLTKWKSNIFYSLKGDTMVGDRNRVIRAVNQINSLGLPIKISEAKKADKSNLVISFGSKNQLSIDDEIAGNSSITSSNGVINKVLIRILNEGINSLLTFNVKREAVILHEIVHSLGLPGHSYSYSYAILRVNLTIDLTYIDKEVIKLLYEHALSAGYNGKQFEKDFGDVLYHVNSEEKFLNFVQQQHINKKALQLIYNNGLIQPEDKTQEECVVKFAFPAIVTVKNNCPLIFIEMIKKAIEQINTSSDGLKLIFTKQKNLKNTDGIYFTFKRDTSMEPLDISISRNWDLRFPGMTKSEISIKYKNTDNIQLDIANSLYRSLCLPSHKAQFELIKGQIYLKPEYKEILQVYYNSSLPSGFKKSELREVIDKLR